uniref:Crystallin zeta like 1 n=1 Tax=Accipiter nisus TaxID=211598 RepID=A0A8B9M120_9AVES
MKALYCQQNSPGEEVTFVFQERENLPPTRDNDVKVQVRACALSWIDTKLLSEIKLEKELLPVGREISGVVLEVGRKVTFFQPDDEVVGILPLDSEESGLCEVILVHEHYLVRKPEKVCWVEAAGTVRDGVRAYTALHYLSQVSPGKTVLVMDGASPFGTIAIQLAQHRGAKVISTAYSLEDKQYLERLRPPVEQNWQWKHRDNTLCMCILGLHVHTHLQRWGVIHFQPTKRYTAAFSGSSDRCVKWKDRCGRKLLGRNGWPGSGHCSRCWSEII